jgi:hypothetical protein
MAAAVRRQVLELVDDELAGAGVDQGGVGSSVIAAVTAASTDNQKTDSPLVGWTG